MESCSCIGCFEHQKRASMEDFIRHWEKKLRFQMQTVIPSSLSLYVMFFAFIISLNVTIASSKHVESDNILSETEDLYSDFNLYDGVFPLEEDETFIADSDTYLNDTTTDMGDDEATTAAINASSPGETPSPTGTTPTTTTTTTATTTTTSATTQSSGTSSASAPTGSTLMPSSSDSPSGGSTTAGPPTTPGTLPPISKPPPDEGLSDGEIAAIVIGSAAGVALIAGGGYYVYIKREKYVELNGSSMSSDPMPPFDNPAYSTNGTEAAGYQFGKSTL